MYQACARTTLSCLAILAAIALLGCTPQPGPSRTAPASGDETARALRATSTRPLNIGLIQEPVVMGGKFGGGGTGVADYNFLFAAKLVRYDQLGNPVAVLVEEVPSLQNGSWRVLDDGRMETTYRLRPSASWHDGSPLTTDDVTFTFAAIMNPELP